MNRKLSSAALSHCEGSRAGWLFALIEFVLILSLSTGTPVAAQTSVEIVSAEGASTVEKIAADELASHLHVLYPSTAFIVGAPQEGLPAIYLGTAQNLPQSYTAGLKTKLDTPDSFVIKTIGHDAVIAGESPRAVLFAVDALLEKLGFGFYLSYNTSPSPSPSAFSLSGWEMEDTPIAAERVIFDWHNFLSGCSTWNLDDWQSWVTQASRMRFNTIMVHAYGNNPMYSFQLNGVTKPTGYLANTEQGRDWGTEHVLDVRRIVGAKGLFSGPVFGADASLVPENDTVKAATDLMQKVFRFAADRGMGVTFALDVDTEAVNPQKVIGTLPASARFESRGLQFVNPDVPEGYIYYKAEIEQLMQAYPQITQLAVWFRGATDSPWRALQPKEFPAGWNQEYTKGLEANPFLKNDPDAPSMFAIGKIAKAFRKALDETGHPGVALAAGSWRFNFLSAANVFMPPNVALMPLDYGYEFPSDPAQEKLRVVGRQRSVVPIVWAQHDDREYAGRSYVPFAGFGSMLQWSNSAGYGVIHWTTRPLDLFFKNVADQVWRASENENLDRTASEMAGRTFGMKAQETGKRYLYSWIYDAPAFGRETTDRFIDQAVDLGVEMRGAKKRVDLLDSMKPLAENANAQDRVSYFEDWEHYAEGFFEAQTALQKSLVASRSGDIALARREISQASPESVIEQYGRTIRHGITSPGEKGILISMNLRWLPYFAAQRQLLGLDALRVEFAPTFEEPLAFGPGRYTFDFDSSNRIVEVLGSRELGIEVKRFESSAKCPTGIQLYSPQALTIGGLAGTGLPAGAYRMKLNMPQDALVQIESAGQRQTISSTLETEVWARNGRIAFTLAPLSGSIRVCGLTITSPIKK